MNEMSALPSSGDNPPPGPYTLALCRPPTMSVFDQTGWPRREVLDANIAIMADHVRQAAEEHGARLVVFPQFALTGYSPLGPEAWAGACVRFPGPEMERLGEAARKAGAYVAVQVAEAHDAFPGRYFLSTAILTPDGGIGLAYRKNYSLSVRTSPVDVFDRFVETFGHDAFLPVLDTELGCLGVTIGAEPHWPEPIRAMALKGAEVILNPIAALQGIDYLERPGADIVRPVRAFENVAYFATSNIAGGAVASQAWDYEGRAIGESARSSQDSAGHPVFTLARIDIAALRAARMRPAGNLLVNIQPQIQEDPRALPLWPSNTFPEAQPEGFDALIEMEQRVWRGLVARGRGKVGV
ncbi:hypothetical protein I5E68_14280 [Novosphingobium sp. YJ-S2-02]|uniref:CN hydrolase domain-containing protein n=1 Tax=Novosphingobium aureum TaxID=2792964 RepID=A0A931HET6_9SPHN|nr:nitrilase-related carbon-nitrogen hydrolase [Novosphingobium aureum]MBH0114108.1 hypothetical protein [Novosphingobium aureum]